MMHPKPPFQAVVCVACQEASLVPVEAASERPCASCGASRVAVAGARYIAEDIPRFGELECLVRSAHLSRFEATSIALELESVSLRWEPPELVLERIGERMPGLKNFWDAANEYPQLLLTVSMLLTAVLARVSGATHSPRRRRQASGVFRVVEGDDLLAFPAFRTHKHG